MNEQQIKQDANSYFSEKNYEETITTLWKVGLDGFIDYCIKKKWFAKTVFVEELLKHAEIFTSVFNSHRADELLFNYFKSKNKFSEKFEREVASEFPKLYINAFRVSHVFLDEKRFNFLDTLEISEEFQIHKKVWKKLQDIDKQFWSAINFSLEKLSDIPIPEILTDTAFWLKNKMSEKSRLQDVNHLASVYSFFIELYFENIKLENITQEHFNKAYNKNNEKINQDLVKLLENINQWIIFNDTTLSAYCFDLNISPKEENEIIFFNQLPETYYNWKLDGIRYAVTRNEYFFRFVQQDNIPVKKEDFIYVGNEKLRLFLDDLKIKKLNNIEVENLYSPLIKLSVNCKPEFDNSENKLFFLFNKNEFLQNKIDFFSDVQEDTRKQIISLFSYKKRNEFDRFNIKYNVWYQPFINISGNLFCPKIFLADNDWFFAFAQAGIQNLHLNRKERKVTSTLMEENLGKIFEEKGWTVKVTTEEDENKMNGDVDVIVEDKYTTLYIQSKRTYFRFNLKDTYYELINSDRKASQQLNDGEKSLSTENEIFNPKHKPVKWIVTTSYENILTNINGCIKVNFFDILDALKRPFGETLQDLIDFIYKDKQILNLINIYNSGLPEYEFYAMATAEIGLPIPLVYPSKYRIAVFSENENFLDYNKIYEKAIELDKAKKYEKAIHLLYKCLDINPDDLDVYIALGNAYANTGKYKEAIKAFKEALIISPQDPYVLREYSGTLMESGKYYEGLNMVLNLCEKYPFIGDFRYLYEFKYHQLSTLKLLKYEQKVRLKRRWDKLQ